MDIVALLFAWCIILYWTLLTDLPVGMAPISSVSAFGKRVFSTVNFFVTASAFLALAAGFLPSYSIGFVSPDSPSSLFAIALATLLAMSVSYQISAFSPLMYALMGACMGYELFSTGTLDGNYSFRIVISWWLAPVISLSLSFCLYKLYRVSIGKLKMHVIALGSGLKYLVFTAVLLLCFAWVLNNGNAVLWLGNHLTGHRFLLYLPAFLLPLFFLSINKFLSRRINLLSEREFDINVNAALSVVFSSAIVLLLFSNEYLMTTLSLRPSPISLPSLYLAAVLGVGLAQKREKLEKETWAESAAAFVATPLLGMLFAYFITGIIRLRETSSPIGPFSKMLLWAGFILLAVSLYVIYRKKTARMANRMACLQKQGLFESQRDLDILEIKSILAENQNLHKRLEQKRSELINVALKINEQKDYMEAIRKELKDIAADKDIKEKEKRLKEMEISLMQRNSFSEEIDGFYTKAEMLHKDFSIKLNEKFPSLTPQEKKLATLLRLGFSTKEISTFMNISPKSAEIGRYRLRKKLGLKHADNLIRYIKSI